MSAVIAERRLDYFDDAGAKRGFVRFFAPERDQEFRAWSCAYRIKWPGFDRRQRILGEDSFQALQLAMRMAPVEIECSDDFKAGRIGMWGEPLKSVRKLNKLMGLEPIGSAKKS